MEKSKPIGIFDSGAGGLSIGHAIRRVLPREDLVYFADLGFSPYGMKSKNIIEERSEYIAEFLLKQDCKAVVVACNTATVNSIGNLRSKFSIPIIGVEPAIKPAALQSKTGVIGVLATKQTLGSDSYQQLEAKYAEKVNIISMACPEFVSLVESVNHDTEQATEIAKQYVIPLLSKGCDQIVLGCTHFSFLKSTIDKVAGAQANIIDTAEPVALEVKRRLEEINQLNFENAMGKAEFWTSGSSTKVAESIGNLWGRPVEVFKTS